MQHTTHTRERIGTGVALAVAATLALAACAPGTTSAGETPGQVVVAWTGDLTSMDPPNNPVEWNREVAFNTYETLINYDYTETGNGDFVWNGLDLAPGLASSWEIDGATVTFQLEEDAVFYPSGNPVTAEDVKWTFERALAHPTGFGLFNFNLAGIFDATEQIEVIDEKTLAITYKNSSGEEILLQSSLPSLRFPHFSIIDSAAALDEASEEDPWATEFLDENTLGSGPYFVESWTPNEQITFEAVPDHYRGAPEVSRVVARITGSADVVALMKSGDIDLARAGVGTRQLDELENAGYTVRTEPVPNIVQLYLAMDDERLTDLRVREALAHAIPYEQIIDVAFSGRGERATSYVNPQSPGFVPAWADYSTDLETAQSLLDDAGVDSLSLPLYYDSGVVYNEDVALLIKNSFAEIGVDLELIAQPTTQHSEQRTGRIGGTDESHSGLLLSSGTIWLDDPDPNTDTYVKSSGGSNWSRYSNQTVDSLHLDNRFNQDLDARAAAYEEIQALVAADLPQVPILVTGRSVVTEPQLRGFAFTPDVMTRYSLLDWVE